MLQLSRSVFARIVLALAFCTAINLALVQPPAATAANRTTSPLTSLVQATGISGTTNQATPHAVTNGSFVGTATVTGFSLVGGVLMATGTLVGNILNSVGGVIGAVNTTFTVPVGVAGTCQILHLTLGPLDLNLLGLMVHLNQVVLTITAQAGPGNLLGNLLCDVANLLNTSPLNLSALLQDLTGILGAL